MYVNAPWKTGSKGVRCIVLCVLSTRHKNTNTADDSSIPQLIHKPLVQKSFVISITTSSDHGSVQNMRRQRHSRGALIVRGKEKETKIMPKKRRFLSPRRLQRATQPTRRSYDVLPLTRTQYDLKGNRRATPHQQPLPLQVLTRSGDLQLRKWIHYTESPIRYSIHEKNPTFLFRPVYHVRSRPNPPTFHIRLLASGRHRLLSRPPARRI